MSLTNKKEFRGIDFIKFVMAIFVVAIHTMPFGGLGDNTFTRLWNIIVTIAVPYFFIASGFLLFFKVNKGHDKAHQLNIIKQYLIRIIKLYIYWTIIFLPITIWKFSTDNLSAFVDLFLFLRRVFLIGENYYSWPLWYLLSMIYSLVLIYFLIYKKKKINLILIVSVLVFFISILMGFIIESESSNEIILQLKGGIVFVFGSGRLFTGMLYIMIGALFASQKIQFSRGIWCVLFLVDIILRVFYLPLISQFSFVLLPSVMFHIALNMKFKVIKNGYFFRKSSTVIYFMHMIVLFLYTLIFKEFKYCGWDAFLISVLIPIVITPIVIKYENKYRFLKEIF